MVLHHNRFHGYHLLLFVNYQNKGVAVTLFILFNWFWYSEWNLPIICDSYGPKTLNDLQKKIDNSEWIWERWPVCETIEFGRSKLLAVDLIDSIQSFKFDQCPNLEKIILNVAFDLKELAPNCRQKIATVKQLTFDPKTKIQGAP